MTIFKSPYDDVALRDRTITQHIFSGLEGHLDKAILIDGPTGHTMTAVDFIDRVKRLAGGLQAAGYGAGKTVGLMAPNSPEYGVIFHAVAWAGGTITTLNPTHTAREVAHQLADADADILITVPDLTLVAKNGAGVRPVFALGTPGYESLYGKAQDIQTPVDLDNHVVVLPYSSGTTGLPKGVMLTHRNLVVNIDQTLAAFGFDNSETVVAFLPFFHIYGMMVVLNMYLSAAGTVVTMPRFDLPQFLQLTQDHKAERMIVVPPVALALAGHPIVDQYDLSHLKTVTIAAAPSSAELTDTLAARLNCTVLQAYGMTELSPASHVDHPLAPKSGSCGVSIPNTICKIVDPETGAEMGAHEAGELWITGPQVMKGYLGNPEATNKTLTEDGWLRTGDMALIDAEGHMFIVDRLKELIKYKGFQVAPAELEATLVAMDGIKDAAVIGLPDTEAGEVPIAFVVRAKDGPDESAIHAHFKANLSTYKQLHRITFVDEVPKSASGKILRRLLRDQMTAVSA